MKVESLDCRNLLCPLPVIRVQNLVQGLPAGALVEALCSDPGALEDVPAWCRINGHQIWETRRETNDYFIRFRVTKTGA